MTALGQAIAAALVARRPDPELATIEWFAEYAAALESAVVEHIGSYTLEPEAMWGHHAACGMSPCQCGLDELLDALAEVLPS